VETAPQTSIELVDDDRSTPRKIAIRSLILLGALLFASFWVWALFFASKQSINKIDDRVWADRAETICADATVERLALADFREIEPDDATMIREQAVIVDASTDILENMLDDVSAQTPADDKGRSIVPIWEDEYRTYLADRRVYADELRRTGENLPFYETAVGIPISERLETFAVDNEMPSCAPPRDLTR
jgi:hypothetical protein